VACETAIGVLVALDAGLVTSSSGSALHVLGAISDIVEDKMGGTSGGIFALFVSALAGEVRKAANGPKTTEVELWAAAARGALGQLSHYTAAKVGDRTLMDVLIPYVETLAQTKSVDAAVAKAQAAAEGTAKLTPKLGRATYVGDVEGGLPPDPGAYAVLAIVQGLADGSKG
jgi:triose/dihydroxyacetone kinase / FAD-AMP lyase (cyclizing)